MLFGRLPCSWFTAQQVASLLLLTLLLRLLPLLLLHQCTHNSTSTAWPLSTSPSWTIADGDKQALPGLPAWLTNKKESRPPYTI